MINLKKLLSILLCLLLILSTFTFVSFSANADENLFTEGYLTYSISNGEAIIESCETEASGDIIIPYSLGGYPVTKIDSWVFSWCESIKSVVIPEKVTSIGAYAFYYCTSLEKVVMGDNVVTIDENAFNNCKSLSDLTVSKNLTTISDKFTTCGTGAFSGCNISKLIIADGSVAVKSIMVISDDIEEVEIPNSVLTISDKAFSDCTKLKSINIPDSVTSIGEKAFYRSGLNSVTLSENVKSIGKMAFSTSSSLKNVTILGDNVVIGAEAFKSCSSLESVSILGSLSSVGGEGFRNCNALYKVNVADISAWCNIDFADLTSNPLQNSASLYFNDEIVVDLTIPDDVTTIKDYTFYKCESLRSVILGSKVTSVGAQAFSYCGSIENIELNNKLRSISNNAFANCTSLKNVVIPNSVTNIGNQAFSFCSSLENITFSNTLTSIGESAFQSCSVLESVVIPDSVTTIGSRAFQRCSGLKFVSIGNGVTCIKNETFASCTSLESVTLSNSVERIEYYAFYSCKSLKKLTLGSKIKAIWESAIYECNSLKSVFYAGSESDWDNISIDFDNDSLNKAKVFYNVKTFDGFRYIVSGNEATILDCDTYFATRVNVPVKIHSYNVTAIADDVFDKCEKATIINIPDSVTSIGVNSFDNFTIYCNENSYAHTYSVENGLNYHAHIWIDGEAVAPTCTETGLTEGVHCSACGETLMTQETVDALGHTEVVDEAVASTCIETGLTEGKHCSVCNEVLIAQETIEALGHKAKTVNVKKATYVAAGYTGDKKCSVCGDLISKGKSIAKLKLKTPKFTLKGAKGKFTVKYTSVKDATGFEIKYKIKNGKFKTVKVTTKKSMSKVISKLKKGKYSVQIRAFVKQSGKTANSNWTNLKSVTVK